MAPDSAGSSSERRTQVLLLGTVWALCAAGFLAYLHFALEGTARANDFLVFWSAARYVQQAPLHEVYDPATFEAFRLTLGDQLVSRLPFVYPPFTAFLFTPFGMLPFDRALLLWNAGCLGLYLAAVWATIKPGLPAALAALVAPATVVTLMAGQVGLLTAALTLLGIAQLGRRPVVAGVLLGLLALKPQLALLPCLVLLTSRQHRACIAAALTVSLLVLASVLAFGIDAWIGWVHGLGGFAGGLNHSAPHQLYGITVYFTLLSLGLDQHLALAAQALTTLLVLWTVTRALRRGLGAPQRMLIVVGVYLATPYAEVYDMPAISAACLMLVAEGRSTGFRSGELLALAAAWFAPLILVLPHVPSAAVGLTVIVGLFVLLLRRAQAPPMAPVT